MQPRHLIRDFVRVAKEVFPRSIELDFRLSEDLENITGDATQFQQVLMNLCVNARDAMPNGGRILVMAEGVSLDESFARMRSGANPGRYVRITVSDTGTGIPSDLIDKIFDPFFTTKAPGRGTGLGLSTVLGIVKGHGGFVSVESQIGKGTDFQVYLPAAESPLLETATEGEGKWTGNGETILVVDDEPAVIEITRRTLELNGYRVVTASDGAEALALYAQHRGEIAVVLMDMVMPYLDGAAASVALRRLDPDVKLVAMSGVPVGSDRFSSPQAGAREILRKPFTAEKLLSALAEIIAN
jgi:hypothetical protein